MSCRSRLRVETCLAKRSTASFNTAIRQCGRGESGIRRGRCAAGRAWWSGFWRLRWRGRRGFRRRRRARTRAEVVRGVGVEAEVAVEQIGVGVVVELAAAQAALQAESAERGREARRFSVAMLRATSGIQLPRSCVPRVTWRARTDSRRRRPASGGVQVRSRARRRGSRSGRDSRA